MTTSATFEIAHWDEEEFDTGDTVAKLTTVRAGKTYSGRIQGTSETQWVMAYNDDGTAAFVGMERIRGSIDGRHGTLVVRHVGMFSDGAARATLTVISGTDALVGAAGTGWLVADPGGKVSLDLSLAKSPT